MSEQILRTFTGTGFSDNKVIAGHFNATIAIDAFDGVIQLQRSFDGAPFKVVDTYTGNGTTISGSDGIARPGINARDIEVEQRAKYRWECTAFVGGSAEARIGVRGPVAEQD